MTPMVKLVERTSKKKGSMYYVVELSYGTFKKDIFLKYDDQILISALLNTQVNNK